jgi:hypothetical protein
LKQRLMPMKAPQKNICEFLGIKTIKSILKQAGSTPEEFEKYLK